MNYNIYQNQISGHAKRLESDIIAKSFKNSQDPLKTGIVPKFFNNNILNQTNKFEIHDQLADIKEHNNLKDTIISPLTGKKMTADNFSHNNMVPFFGSNITQNTSNEKNFQNLERFNGNNQYYKNKVEVQNLFEPKQSMHFVNGTPSHDQELLNRYVPSNKKQNELPMKQVRVGPGLNQGYSSTPCGGLNQTNKREFTLPKNVDQLRVKTNPKLQYKGRVIAGLKESQRGITAKPNKNKPETYYINSPDRYFSTVTQAKDKSREKFRVKRTNRQCSREHKGAAGPVNHNRPSKRGLYKKSTKNIYINSGVRNADSQGKWKGDDDENYGKNSIDLPMLERDTTQKEAPKLNLTSLVKSIVAPVQDLLKTSKKENFIGNTRPNGNFGAQMPKKMTVHDVNDIARTTIKETNIHNNRSGNMNGPNKLTVYDPNDIARTTIKETNIHNNKTGNLSGPSKIQVHDPNDIARTTIKETNIHNTKTGNLSGPSKIQVHDPNDIARTTIKETNIHNNRKGNFAEHSGGKNKIPMLDKPKVTVRNTVEEVDKTINMSGYRKQTVHDPNDVPQATVKDTNIHHVRAGSIGTQGQDKGSGYLTKGVQAPNTHRQFTSDIEYTGMPDGDVGKGSGEGYLVSNYNAKNVNRQFISDNDYVGSANSEHEKPTSYESSYNAELNYNKEKIAVGRSPTKQGLKNAIGEDKINIDIKKLESDIVNIRDMNVDKIYSSVPGKVEGALTQERAPLQQDINMERLENDILKAFKENPLTQSLSSY